MQASLLIHPSNPWEFPTLSRPSVNSLASTLAHFRGHRKSSQSLADMLEHRDTYGQAKVGGKGCQGSSVDRLCQLSFCQHVLTCTESATYHSTASQCFGVLKGRRGRANCVQDRIFLDDDSVHQIATSARGARKFSRMSQTSNFKEWGTY